MASIKLFTFNELYSIEGLKKIDNKFLGVVKEKNLKLYEKLNHCIPELMMLPTRF